MFYLFSLLFFVLGLISKKSIYLFLIVLLVFPFGNAFSLYFYKSGLYSYDFFFIGFILSRFIALIYSKKLILPNLQVVSYILLLVYFIFALYNVNWDLYLVRDIRLVLYITYISIFFSISVTHESNTIRNKSLLNIVLFAACSNLVYLLLSLIGFFSFTDNFYSENSFRYFDISTYVCSLFVIFYTPSKNKLYYLVFSLASVCVLVSGIRVLILLTLFLAVLRRMDSASSVIKISLIVMAAIVTMPFVFVGSDDVVLISRITNLSLDIIVEQIYTRYSPFFNLLDSFSWYNYLLGKGIGTTFFIPWFEYREAKDSLNNFIDSTYVTLYSKFGLFFILYLISAIVTMIKIASFENNKDKVIFVIFSLSLMIVYALPYQASSLGIIIGLYLIRLNIKNVSEGNVR